jgi:hypothetical protein
LLPLLNQIGNVEDRDRPTFRVTHQFHPATEGVDELLGHEQSET